MGIKISHTYTNNINYKIGDNVGVYDESVSKDHAGQNVSVPSAGASNTTNNKSTPEELDLSLDSDKGAQTDSQGVKAGHDGKNNITAEGAKTNQNNTTDAGQNGVQGNSTQLGQTKMGNNNTSSTNYSNDTGSSANGERKNNGAEQPAAEGNSGSESGVNGQSVGTGNGTGTQGGNQSLDSGLTTTGSNHTSTGNSTGGLTPTGSGEKGDGTGDLSVGATDGESETYTGPHIVIIGNVVTITYSGDNGEQVSEEMELDDFTEMLRKEGITDQDIQRVIDGVIQLVDLYCEIDSDPDNTRRRLMYEAYCLSKCNLEYTNLEELKAEINRQEDELEKLKEQDRAASKYEYEFLSFVVSQMSAGYNLDEIRAYKYVDENNVVRYVFNQEEVANAYNYSDTPVYYEPVSFEDEFPNNKDYQTLKELTAVEIKPIWAKEASTIHIWQYTDEQYEIMSQIYNKAAVERTNREDLSGPIEEQIDELNAKIQYNKAYFDYLSGEVSYYMNSVDAYIHAEDFMTNMFLDPVNYQVSVNAVYSRASDSIWVQVGAGTAGSYSLPQIYLTDGKEITDLLAAMINGDMDTSGLIIKGYNTYQLNSNDTIFNHYLQLIEYMSNQEKAIFNYKYNTEGYEAAHAYLEEIAVELDNRALQAKRQQDAEFAHAHPVLASIYSIFVTPIEGMAAFSASMNSIITGDRIWRIDVYSPGDTMRGTVAADIALTSPTLSFLYSTGMSMADTGLLIGMGFLTGGVGMPIISAVTMGSRAYVSTINDALDRGISDGRAVALAFTAAVVETAMESYSAGHLLNLEKNISKTALNFGEQLAGKISNPTVSSIFAKGFNIFAAAVCQGICEGEEEFATEILDTAADIIISKDLSNMALTLENYKAIGYSDDQAFIATIGDFGSQVFEAFLGGFVSGVCFGSFSAVRTNKTVSYGIAHDMMNEIEGKTSGQQFINALITNQQQIESIKHSHDIVTNVETEGMTKVEAVTAKAKQLGLELLGIETVTPTDINQALNDGKITTEQAALMLQGTLITNVRREMKTEFQAKLNQFKEQIKNKIDGAKLLLNINNNFSEVKAGSYGDIGTNYNEAMINNTRYAIGQLMIRFGCSYYQALGQVENAIIEQNYNRFTSMGNSRSIMQQYTWGQISEAFKSIKSEYVEKITSDVELIANSLVQRWQSQGQQYSIEDALNTINDYVNGRVGLNYITSLNDSRNIIQKYSQEELTLGLDNYVNILNAMVKVRDVIALYKQKYSDMSYEDIILNIEIYLQTHNLANITRNGGARDMIAHMTDYEISSALARIKGEYVTRTIIQEQTQDVTTLFDNLWNAISQNRKSDYRAISLLYQGLAAQVNKGQSNAIAMVKQLTAIFAANRGLSIISTTPSDCYWSNHNNNVHMGQLNIEMGDFGTMMHELGHCLFDKVLSTALPYGSQDIIAKASDNATRNRRQYEHRISQIRQQVDAQVSREFDEDLRARGLTLQQYQQQLASKYAYGDVTAQLRATLRSLGISDKNIKEILKTTQTVQDAVEEEIRAQKRAISDRIWRTKYGVDVAISDIMDAIFMGSHVDNRGSYIDTQYGHGEDYYKKSGNPTEYQFHEIIANFTQVCLTGTQQDIQLLQQTFGTNFVSMLDQTFKAMLGIRQQVDYNTNIDNQNKGLLGKIKNIFGTPKMDLGSASSFSIDPNTDTTVTEKVEEEFKESIKVEGEYSTKLKNLLFTKIKEQIESGNPYARSFMDSLIGLFRISPTLKIDITEDTSFYSNLENRVNIKSTDIQMGVVGTLYHELTHLLHDRIMYFYTPMTVQHTFEIARKNAERNIKRFNKLMENTIITGIKKVNAKYEEIVSQKYGSMEAYKKIIAAKFEAIDTESVGSVPSLRDLGFTTEEIEELKQKAVQEQIANEKRLLRSRLWQTDYKLLTAISDIMDALYLGKTITDNGTQIKAPFGHFADYYANLNEEEASRKAYMEMIAQYGSIVLSGSQEAVQLMYEIFGMDLVGSLDFVYKKILGMNAMILPEVYDRKGNRILYYDAQINPDILNINQEALDQNIQLNAEEIRTNSEKNLTALEQKILSKITPEMTQLEITRLLYYELGRNIEYSEYYLYLDRYNGDETTKTQLNELYKSKVKLADLETDNRIICLSWAQIYAEMLMKAGFKKENIIIQRAVDAKTEDLANLTHVGIVVKLDDGSIVIPELTAPIAGQNVKMDYYNVKANKETTGFILITKEQIEKIIQLKKGEITAGNDELLKTVSQLIDKMQTIEEVITTGNYDYDGNIIELTEDEIIFYSILGQMLHANDYREQLPSKLGKKRISIQRSFFSELLSLNRELILKADKPIEKLKADTTALIKDAGKLTEKNKKGIEIISKGQIETGKIDIQFLGLSLFNTRSILEIENHLQEMIVELNLSDQVKIGYIGDTKLRFIFNQNNSIMPIEITHNDQISRYVIRREGNIITINKMTKEYEMIMLRLKDTTIPTEERIILGKILPTMNLEQMQQAVQEQGYVFDTNTMHLESLNNVGSGIVLE